MEITVGCIVLYTLDEQDAEQINRRRTNGHSIADRIAVEKWPLGAQAHIGNQVKAGEQFPMMVTKVWSPGYVNGQVFLDGNDCFWATSVQEGMEGMLKGHSWSWPPESPKSL